MNFDIFALIGKILGISLGVILLLYNTQIGIIW